jgi:hypothetical protein
MKTLTEMRALKQTAEVGILGRPGVTGVDIGNKIVDGKITDELAIRVFVAKKRDVPDNEKLPKTIQGVKTDVIERTYVLHQFGSRVRLSDLKPHQDKTRYDELRGGVSIGPSRSVSMTPPDVEQAGDYVFVGTLGALVKDDATGSQMMLSNFHVMCVDSKWKKGDTICQPSRVDAGTSPADIVGSLDRASLGGEVDCAVASLSSRKTACEIVDIGKVAGKAVAAAGMAVRKRGRTSGLTHGVVDSVDLTIKLDYGDGLGEVTLTHQIGIDVNEAQNAIFGDHGDSGSVVVNSKNEIVGLYFAGSDDGKHGIANPIDSVLAALKVSICIPAVEGKPKKTVKGEFKELLKLEKPEIKEHKDFKSEFKEWKEHKPEKVEIEFGKVPIAEQSPMFNGPTPAGTGADNGSLEARVAALEAALAQLPHFISRDQRPDLSKGALSNEPDGK